MTQSSGHPITAGDKAEPKEVPKLNLQPGYFMFMVLRVLEQKHSGLKVIYDAGLPFGGPGVRLALDERDALFFQVIDCEATEFSTPGIPSEQYLARPIIALCSLRHLPDGQSRVSLEVAFLDTDNECTTERIVRGQWGDEAEVIMSIMASILGESHAASECRAFAIRTEVPTAEEKANLVAWARADYGVLEPGP